MAVSIPVAVLRRRVRLDLRRHRENCGLTQRQAAQQLGIGEKNIGHYEGGRNLPNDMIAADLLRIYEALDEIPEFLRVLADARKRTPSTAAAADPEQYGTYAALEQGASQLDSYDALVLHGLAQTAEYAEAVMRGHGTSYPEAEVRRRLRARIQRQDVLTGDDPTHLWLIIKESVLHEPIGGPDVMRGQLDHLIELSERPHIEVQVIPRDVAVYPALHGPFTRLSFNLPNDPGVVYIETRVKGLFLEEAAELQEYEQVMAHLRVLAAAQDDSRQIITAARKEIA
jgi:DNA-binding XRE family transcriptional regulator